MDVEAVFNRYDIRGAYPDEIDDEFAERMGKAVGTYAQNHGRHSVVTGRDTRDTSHTIYDAFQDGLAATGITVMNVGYGTTDRTALAARHHGTIGVMVTASHHAWERTGFKLLYSEGHGFSNKDMGFVKELFKDNVFNTGDGAILHKQDEFDEHYIDAVKDAFHDVVDEDLSAHVILDAIGGAERTAPFIFEELGATVTVTDRDIEPDPTPSSGTREDVQEQLMKTGADIAVGYDPDGDRVYAIHPEMGWLDGDRILYALIRILNPGNVVASIDSSPIIETLGVDVTYTRVGDVFVSEKGVELGAELLGEPNGHYAVTEFCWYNSGILASLLLAAHHKNLPELLKPVQNWETHRFVETFDSMERRDMKMSTVKRNVAKNFDVVATIDGMKFKARDAVGLVRPSGTSPKIRLIVHSSGQCDTERLRKNVFGN